MIRPHSNFNLAGEISPYARFEEDHSENAECVENPKEEEDELPLFLGDTIKQKRQVEANTELAVMGNYDGPDFQKAWQLNYQEAAIYLEEGKNNEKFSSHPESQEALPTYLLVHNRWYYCMDFVASLILILLAVTEKPALLEISILFHGTVELLALTVIGAELVMKLRWLGLRTCATHTRTAIKAVTLIIMFIEAILVLVRQSSHFRVTRALRPIFLIDNQYCERVRRYLRQVLQSLPPVLDMLGLLLFVMLLFSALGFFLFRGNEADPYFKTFLTSFVNLFVLLTTANFPDVMMPAYAVSVWNVSFFVVYLFIVLYFLLNLTLAVVYASFSTKEKEKLRKLLVHRQGACQRAFRLLLSRKYSATIPFRRFQGMMHFLCPGKRKKDVYLSFRLMNTSGSGELSLSEFKHIFEILPVQWSKKPNPEPYFNSYRKSVRVVCTLIRKVMMWKGTEYFICFVIFVGSIQLVVLVAGVSTESDMPAGATWESMFYVAFYNVEAVLKLVAFGARGYFSSGWNIFDFIVVLMTNVGMILEAFHLFGWMIVRHARLLRIFKIKKRYRDVFGTVFLLADGLASAAVVLMFLYYFFAVIGMEIFYGYTMKNCCRNSTVESYYAFNETTNTYGYYYMNNFDNIVASFITLFELTVVNNWYIIMNGYAFVATEWSRIYFMVFYLTTLVFLNVVIVSVIEGFIFRMQYKSKTSKKEEDKMMNHEVTLSGEELQLVHTGKKAELRTEELVTFVGSSRRTRDVLQTIMYQTDIETWMKTADQAEDRKSTNISDESGA